MLTSKLLATGSRVDPGREKGEGFTLFVGTTRMKKLLFSFFFIQTASSCICLYVLFVFLYLYALTSLALLLMTFDNHVSFSVQRQMSLRSDGVREYKPGWGSDLLALAFQRK